MKLRFFDRYNRKIINTGEHYRSTLRQYLRQGEHGVHESIVVDLDPPIPIRVKPPERFRKLFDYNASTNEAIEGDTLVSDPSSNRLTSFNVYLVG